MLPTYLLLTPPAAPARYVPIAPATMCCERQEQLGALESLDLMTVHSSASRTAPVSCCVFCCSGVLQLTEFKMLKNVGGSLSVVYLVYL